MGSGTSHTCLRHLAVTVVSVQEFGLWNMRSLKKLKPKGPAAGAVRVHSLKHTCSDVGDVGRNQCRKYEN